MEGRTIVNTYNVKSVLLGEPAVGKTSIRRRYLGVGFNTSHLMTIGADFAQKEIEVNPQNTVLMQIWDIAGQDQFRQVRSRFLKNANICLMVFDLTRRLTFERISKWLQDFWQINPEGDIPLLIIGNKADLVNQIEVEKTEVDNLIERLKDSPTSTSSHISYITTSAATGLNIEEAFDLVSRQITQILGNGK